MIIFRGKDKFQRKMLELKRQGVRIGLVPTMGFLHEGHLSLVDEAKKRADVVAMSIFVNPIQFGPNEDLDKYPRDPERDIKLAKARGVDFLFMPEVQDMYAADASTTVAEQSLSQGLCGAKRPGHFDGVATVVAKLFNLAQPDVAVFGQKDAQQAKVIMRMVRDLDFPIDIVIAPLVRDTDGLALSSRNRYLSEEEREAALSLSRSMRQAADELRQKGIGHLPQILSGATKEVERHGGKIDYYKCLDANLLRPVEPETNEVIFIAAVFFGNTRLLDNLTVKL